MITGGATGIGFAIAEQMYDAGANIVIAGRREGKLKEAAAKLGDRCSWYVFDVTETDKHEAFIQKLEEKAPIDILRSLTRLLPPRQRRLLCYPRQLQNI